MAKSTNTKKSNNNIDSDDENTGVIQRLKGIPDQDFYSEKKALVEKVRYVVILLMVLILIAIFFSKNNQNRLIFISNKLESSIALPNVTFCLNACGSCQLNEFIVVNNNKKISWYCNNEASSCSFFGTNQEFAYTDGKCFEIGGPSFNVQSAEEFWTIAIQSRYVEEYPQINFKIININNTDAQPRSFPLLLHSDNNLFFEKSVYKGQNDEQGIESFSPFFQSIISASEPCVDDPSMNCGTLKLQIQATSMMVSTTNEETDSGLAKRTITDVGSIFNIGNIVILLFFSLILSRFLYKDQSAWVNHEIREAVIYHMKNYDPKDIKYIIPDHHLNNKPKKKTTPQP
ncbi:hypothetical protein DLAC_04769 [Tieghemostelium lacteum]|uniref:Transmembrane protein n=1 Tax=Tieghemostelium lacteum TaxID=361077 RepID=A0A151ZKP4_TIELA|nr:hypothetical protein DLAC_04769 [Tieghemostelium lacteum]|eukprot:KYQ94470.1 hypothetical protein DLAC_04769 [Tieghemostelium lacteum]